MYRNYLKSIFDFSLSLSGIFLLSPLWILILLVLLINNKGDVFFIQERPGKNEVIFKIIKFKTMNDKKDEFGHLLPDAQRLTFIGRLVRKTSLDELPQLFNVLKGDMSIVGPRPLLKEYLPLYTPIQKRRHLVKPGITGWAQINGRNAIDWKQKFDFDVYYVDHLTFALDVKILWQTVVNVLQSKNINQVGEATSSIFKGNE